MKKTLLFILLISPFPLFGQNDSSVRSYILDQLITFPQEKVYIHTDKAAYISGEKIWYRIYLVDAALHSFDLTQSRYVYVDLIDPMGRIVSHSMIRPDENDYYHNNIELDGDLPEGYYMIRGYTRYMLNRPDYLFEKKVFISDPQSFTATAKAQFSKAGSRQGSAKLTFQDKEGNLIEVDKYLAGVDTTENLLTYTKEKEVSFRVTPDKKQTLYVAFEYLNRVHRSYFAIPDLEETFDVSFYPEGGYLLADVENVVGFKSVNTKGLSEPVVVELFERGGGLVTKSVSNGLGMGALTWSADSGKSYYALCANANNVVKEVNLPNVRSDVYNIQAKWQEELLLVTARKGKEAFDGNAPLSLLLHVRGLTVHYDKITPDETVVINKELFPSGVIHILLLDKELNPLSERLVFCINNDQALATISTDQSNYGKRGHVQVKVEVADESGVPLSGSYSVSVTDNSDILPQKDFTIGSVLLLSSDLRGYIESPGSYFESDEDRSNDIDALLLTQGWRRYNIPEVVKGVIEPPDEPAEIWQEITGLVKQVGSGKAIENGTVFLFEPQAGIYAEALSDELGRFRFDEVDQPDSIRYIIQASSTKGQETELILEVPPLLKSLPFVSPPDLSKVLSELTLSSTLYQESLKKSDTNYLMEDGIRTRELSPAVVIATRENREVGLPHLSLTTSLYTTGTGNLITPKMVEDEVYETNSIISLLLRNIPFLDIAGSSGLDAPVFYFPMTTSSFSVLASSVLASNQQGRRPAAVFVDNVLMDPEFDVRTIPLTAISSIEGIRRPTSSLFGTGSQEGSVMGGAILIMTKYGTNSYATEERSPNRSIKEFTPLGYKREVEFYAPIYDTPERLSNTTPDLRTTLFWKPNNLLVNGKSSFDFYAADAETTYSIVIEGITDDGRVIRQVQQVDRLN